MPKIYLSPSTQEYNPYVTGAGSEEYFMNLLADAMEPILLLNGIQFSRNTPDMTAASSIRQANAGQYDFYLALHSNASGPGAGGQSRGILAFYYPTSANGRRAAELFVENLRDIYPLPEKVSTRATTSLGEVRQPRFPSVLLELGYHDNPDDALWIQENIPRIAANLVLSLTEYFGLPYTAPTPQPGQVSTVSGGPGEPPLRPLPPVHGNGPAPRRRRRDGVRPLSGLVRGVPRGASGLRQRPLYPPVVKRRQSLPGDLRK